MTPRPFWVIHFVVERSIDHQNVLGSNPAIPEIHDVFYLLLQAHHFCLGFSYCLKETRNQIQQLIQLTFCRTNVPYFTRHNFVHRRCQAVEKIDETFFIERFRA
jgi:hypothetical protein